MRLKNKYGLSEVVSTVMIIGITVVVGVVVWAIVSNLIGEQLEEGETCFGVVDQVQLNRDYTCYNSTSNAMQFSLSVGDINASGIIVSVSYSGTSKSATLPDSVQNIADITNYPSNSTGVKIPSKNSGATYFFNGITEKPILISIIPIIEGKQCGATDTQKGIVDCLALLD
ncbi:MAG: hypothetical protein WD876_00405 [Candidatus Pacearchaeota archaeon]